MLSLLAEKEEKGERNINVRDPCLPLQGGVLAQVFPSHLVSPTLCLQKPSVLYNLSEVPFSLLDWMLPDSWITS